MPSPHRRSFATKAIAAAMLVALANHLFFREEPGWTLGAFALAWIVALLIAVPALRKPAPAATLALATILGLVLVDDPNPLAWLLFWTAVASAALLPRHRFDDALRWAVRLAAYGVIGTIAPLRDLLRLTRRRAPRAIGLGRLAALLALPLFGGALFVALFAAANPLIERALAAVEFPDLNGVVSHGIFWSIVLVAVWPSLRPRSVRLGTLPSAAVTPIDLPVATLTLSLVTFNAIFAVENALDVVFLWSGARLPDGMTMTEYVHRGAYPLIGTALLAGLFVLMALRPGSTSAANATVRRLVTLWVVQNIVLVGSSVLRTLRYIQQSMLTEWRIAALAWMALVAVGLALILWRLLTARSAAWLVNANAAAATIVLLVASVVDLGAIAARWNVDHARRGDAIDLCYLHQLGPSALLPLIDLERRAGGPNLRNAVAHLSADGLADLERGQADWHSWTWRNARRLAAAHTALARHPAAFPTGPRPCGLDDD